MWEGWRDVGDVSWNNVRLSSEVVSAECRLAPVAGSRQVAEHCGGQHRPILLSHRCFSQFRQSRQVVAGGGHLHPELVAGGAAVAQLAVATHRFHPTKDLIFPYGGTSLTDYHADDDGGCHGVLPRAKP